MGRMRGTCRRVGRWSRGNRLPSGGRGPAPRWRGYRICRRSARGSGSDGVQYARCRAGARGVEYDYIGMNSRCCQTRHFFRCVARDKGGIGDAVVRGIGGRVTYRRSDEFDADDIGGLSRGLQGDRTRTAVQVNHGIVRRDGRIVQCRAVQDFRLHRVHLEKEAGESKNSNPDSVARKCVSPHR